MGNSSRKIREKFLSSSPSTKRRRSSFSPRCWCSRPKRVRSEERESARERAREILRERVKERERERILCSIFFDRKGIGRERIRLSFGPKTAWKLEKEGKIRGEI